MRARGCAPDTIVYTAIIDTLWETGVAWAQRSAAQLYRQAVAEGLMRRHSHVCGDSGVWLWLWWRWRCVVVVVFVVVVVVVW